MDNHDKKTRSYNMSMIKSKNTKPEQIVRKYLFSLGFRYRKNVRVLPGSPDIVLPKYKTVIFVNGCFWHGHKGCRYFFWPESNADYWHKKISNTMERDAKNTSLLVQSGWRVLVVWECELKKEKAAETLGALAEEITKKAGQ